MIHIIKYPFEEHIEGSGNCAVYCGAETDRLERVHVLPHIASVTEPDGNVLTSPTQSWGGGVEQATCPTCKRLVPEMTDERYISFILDWNNNYRKCKEVLNQVKKPSR
jgi:hypothetical protein